MQSIFRNLFIVWIITGFWHGAAWNFVLWGMFYFVLIAFEKITGFPQKLKWLTGRYIYRMITLAAVVIGWVLFRSNGTWNALRYIGCMFGLMKNPGIDTVSVFLIRQSTVLFAVAVLCSTPVAPKIRTMSRHIFTSSKGWAEGVLSAILYILLFLVGVSFTVTSTYNPLKLRSMIF